MSSGLPVTPSSCSVPVIVDAEGAAVAVGAIVGETVGTAVGETVGELVGAVVGAAVGALVGAPVGTAVGLAEGETIALCRHTYRRKKCQHKTRQARGKQSSEFKGEWNIKATRKASNRK